MLAWAFAFSCASITSSIVMSPESSVPVVSSADDRRAIHPDQLRALIQMQRYPTAYVQRVVEQLSFLPTGGQHWQRDVQMRLPTDPSLGADTHIHPPRIQPTLQPESKQLFIVSLGMFTRSRFADFSVCDAAGNRLSLLTRLQHGFCLTSCFMFKYFSEEQLPKANLHQPEFDQLWEAVYQQFTTVTTPSQGPLAATVDTAALKLGELLARLGASANEIERKQTRFLVEYTALQHVTQYLCWAVAEPGEAISLSAIYTMADAPKIPAKATSGTMTHRAGVAPPRRRHLVAWLATRRHNWAIRRTSFYATIGLGPLNYELRTPAHDHTGSYYFLVKPPENCNVSYLDWGLDNSIDAQGGEVDCAFNSVHIHNGATLVQGPAPPPARSSIAGSRISAFLRADIREHWPLVIAAILTLLLAILAERGQFVARGGGVSSVLLIAPTALLAYVAQRQSHHYAEATRWMGPLLIGYLFASIVFIASVKYDVLGGDTIFGRANALDDLISGSIALASVGLLLWFGAIHQRDRIIEHYFKRRKGKGDSVARYSALGLRYGDAVAFLLIACLASVIVGALITDGFGWGSGRAKAVTAATLAKEGDQAVQNKTTSHTSMQAASGSPASSPSARSARDHKRKP